MPVPGKFREYSAGFHSMGIVLFSHASGRKPLLFMQLFKGMLFKKLGKLYHSHRWLRIFIRCSCILFSLCLLLFIALYVWILSCKVPQSAVDSRFPGCEIFDCHGELIEVRRGSDWQWCLPISLDQVPAELIEDVIAVEDQRFRTHDGVDIAAMGRAFIQLMESGQVISGASTITMQVVNQYCGRGRGIIYKLRQMGMALNWEKEHSKEQILEDYFNMLPYGGKLHGIEAASRYYFGRSARELNRSEQLLLVGLPQSPNRFRPDRHPERAVWRRDVVLIMLQRAGRITPEEASRIRALPLRYRDFSFPCWQKAEDRDFVELAVRRHPGQRRLHLSIDSSKQQVLRQTLEQWKEMLPGVMDGAGVIIENSSGKVRALVGTLNNGDPKTAQVNAAVAQRSPGSTFKPFIYGEAINGGIITADTLLLDAPLGLKDYRPGNFSDEFLGLVTAARALSDSLNTPAVRLLRELTPERLLRVLSKSGALHYREDELSQVASRCGLSLAIGGVESNLLDLAAAYSALGRPRMALLLEDAAQPHSEAYWLDGTSELLLKMMRQNLLPGAGPVNAAWKTGTSNGNRDAWCFAVTPKWTVGIWYGNKNGRPAEALVGGTAAAPVAGMIVSTLHDGIPPHWQDKDGATQMQELCTRTGLRATTFCTERNEGATVTNIPLLPCTLCQTIAAAEDNNGEEAASQRNQTRILSPAPGKYQAGINGKAEFILRLEPATCHIYLNGRHLGEYSDGDRLTLEPGTWMLLAWNAARQNAGTIMITVE